MNLQTSPMSECPFGSKNHFNININISLLLYLRRFEDDERYGLCLFTNVVFKTK